MKKNKIKFTFLSEYGSKINAARPYPASSKIPQWFKSMDQYADPEGIKIINGMSNATAKKCVPMLDSLTSGYMLSLWSDVLISQNEYNGPELSWKVSSNIFTMHGPSSRDVPPPPGYDNIVLKYNSLLTATTPPGYSILVVPPFGYQDLPFKSIPAIVDTDKPTIDLSFPVWIKSNIEGIVEKGTPIIQIIPFKRESWESEIDFIDQKDFIADLDNNFNSVIKNHYIKNIWSKKSFK